MVEQLAEGLKAKFYGDYGYIGHELKLKAQDIVLIIYHRKNMEALSLPEVDEYHLK